MIHRIAFLLFAICFGVGCTTSKPLDEYRAFNTSPRVILPDEYIAYLKSERFKNGELDHLPPVAIVLHHDDVADYLRKLGYHDEEWTTLQTGQTDPNVMYVVKPKDGRNPFIINRGLPGAGGISTQTAELAALGVKQIVHIGTAGLVGTALPDRAIVVSGGSYKDGAAVTLSDQPNEPISRPDTHLSSGLADRLIFPDKNLRLDTFNLNDRISKHVGVGYTSPIFYFPSEGLIQDLIVGKRMRPAYVEMEEASFFETAKRAHIAAASIVIGSDRYTIDANRKLVHTFFDSTEKQELEALKLAIDVLTKS